MTETSSQGGAGLPAIVVLGAAGMLGQDLVRHLHALGARCVAADRMTCDVTDRTQCREYLSRFPGSAIINCAAYTDVNNAETNREIAFAINATGAENVAYASAESGAALCVYVSTDYVFPGDAGRAYNIDDETKPLNVYGESKLAGEQATLSSAGKSLVVRTSWLYGPGGRNFVFSMLQAASAKRDLRVISDQIGSPTYTVDLSKALVGLSATGSTGIVHATNSGSCSWYEFASAIFEESGIKPLSLVPVSSSEFPVPVIRPPDSRLSPGSLKAMIGYELPHWRDALKRFLATQCVSARG